ncbi:MAG: translesion DNA synthesis-associated protein ImuA [bacterium]|nr:translesion DNA synthesis-associated protein ImuA [Gammaproteobacteria bacterium]HIL98985.1 translesion DNA synthesis-associated protein ImuA [Pseudomonadales bacterium]
MSQPSPSKQSLDKLLQNTGIWRASNFNCTFQPGISTGFALLDQYLPGSGWPEAGLTELLHDSTGIGEFRLIAPALARLTQQQSRWILWVSPPYIPYAPALANAGIDLTRVLIVNPATNPDTLWVLEKALASRSCSAVIAWPGNLKEKQLRRLQVASKEGHCLGFLYRPNSAGRNASPAELRIQLQASLPSPLSEHTCLRLKILKRKGGWATDEFTVEFSDELNQMTPNFSELAVKNLSTDSPLAFIDNHNFRPSHLFQ